MVVGMLALGAAAWLIVHTVQARARRARELAEMLPPPELASALVQEIPDAGAVPTDAAPSAPADAALAAPPPVWRVSDLRGDPANEYIEGIIGKRPFSTALAVAGVSRGETQRIVKALLPIRSFDRVAPKDTFIAVKEKKTGRVLAFEYATSPGEVWQARAREGDSGVLEGKKLDLHVERARIAFGVVVGDDLRSSLVSAGIDGGAASTAAAGGASGAAAASNGHPAAPADDLLDRLDDALEGHAQLADFRSGARLRIVATEERISGQFSRYVALDALEYTPASGAAPTRVYHHSGGRAPGYYDAKGHQPYRGGWRTPVPFARVTSRFNPRRMHPVLHVVMPHNGVDFAASTGTPVFSAASGTVVSVGDGGACGNMVQVKHPNGLVSAYCHLSRFAPGLHAGQHVDARQLVGYAGQTGRVTGPHLHFAVKRGEAFIDPLALKLDGVKVLPHDERDGFMKMRVELDGVLDTIVMSAPMSDAGVVPASDAGTEDTVLDEAP